MDPMKTLLDLNDMAPPLDGDGPSHIPIDSEDGWIHPKKVAKSASQQMSKEADDRSGDQLCLLGHTF